MRKIGTMNKRMGSAPEHVGRQPTIPWYISAIVTIICAATIYRGRAIGALIPVGAAGVVVTSLIVVAIIYGFIPVWRSRDMAKITSAFLLLLPVLYMLRHRVHLGFGNFRYGPAFLATLLFLLMSMTHRIIARTPSQVPPSLKAYCLFGFLSVGGAFASVFSALDQYLLVIIVPVMFFSILVRIVRRPPDAWWLAIGVIGFAVITVVLSFFRFSQVATIQQEDIGDRLSLRIETLVRFSPGSPAQEKISGIGGASAITGRAVMIAIPFSLALLLRRRSNWPLRLAVVACMVLMGDYLLLGYSRAVIYSVLMSVVLFLLLARGKMKRRLAFLLLLIGFMMYPWLEAYFSSRRLFLLREGTMVIDTSGRFEHAFPLVWRVFLDHPITGVGMGRENFQVACQSYGRGLRHAHNMFLQLLSDRGILATTAFCVFYFALFFRAIRFHRVAISQDMGLLRAGMLASLLGITLYFQTSSIWVPNRAFLYDLQFWALLAISHRLPFLVVAGNSSVGSGNTECRHVVLRQTPGAAVRSLGKRR